MLSIARNNLKDRKKKQLSVFNIKVDIIAKLSAKKLKKTIQAIKKVLANQLVAFLNI